MLALTWCEQEFTRQIRVDGVPGIWRSQHTQIGGDLGERMASLRKGKKSVGRRRKEHVVEKSGKRLGRH